MFVCVTMHRGLSACLSPILQTSVMHFGENHPEQTSKHPGLFCSGKMYLLVLVCVERSAWYRVVRERDSLRTMAGPSQGMALSHPGTHEVSFLTVRVSYTIARGQYLASSKARTGLWCGRPPRCWPASREG